MVNDANGKWIGYGVGDTDPVNAARIDPNWQAVSLINQKLYDRFQSTHALGQTRIKSVYDAVTAESVALIAHNYGMTVPIDPAGYAVANLDFRTRIGAYPPPAPPRHLCISVGGAGSSWNNGYQYDLGQALDPGHWFHQPIGYPAAAFPMKPSTDAGEVEVARQLALHNCQTQTWGFISYSEGAIVTSDILDRVRTGDLQQYWPTFIGGATWGNPRREQGHTVPAGIDPGGHGIVTPNLVNTPDTVWDFACGKHMVNSPGQDLYTTCGYDGDPESVADEEAIWNIVNYGKVSSVMPLFEQVLKLLKTPIKGGESAVFAILDALNFFGKQLTPHTSYQFVQPIPGDTRDCWRIALDHLNQLGASTPAHS